MALPNFFDKAALAASEVLQGFDHAAFTAFLGSQSVGLAFDAQAAGTYEGQTTLDLAANLLARLYPKLAIHALEGGLEEMTARLQSSCRSINPDIEFAAKLTGVSACIVVGKQKPKGRVRLIYVGSDGWLVRVSTTGPVGSGAGVVNPFGAAAAACFGAANVFRILFAKQLTHGDPDRNFSLSLIDHEPNARHPKNPAIPDVVDLGDAHLVGLGAIGNGFLWAMGRAPSVRGSLNLVDDERVELSNLQRYVLTTQGDRDGAKVEVAARALAGTALTVRPHQGRWGEYLRQRNDWRLERVAVALDSAEDRIAVQASLPRWVCNAWTQTGDLGVSRHPFLGSTACLACLYLPTGMVPNEDQLVAEAIKMPQAVEEVRTLLYHNKPVGADFVKRIASAMTVPLEQILPFAEKPLRAFYSEAVCGGVLLKLGASGPKARAVQAPMAFQSALAGVLLAAEFVAEAASLKEPPPPVVTRINLLRPLGAYLTFPEQKHPSGRCICQDPDYIAAFRAKHAVTEGSRSSAHVEEEVPAAVS